MEFFRAYSSYIIFAFNGVILLVGIVITSKLMTRKDCAACREACAETNQKITENLSKLERRVTRNEDKLDSLPSSDDVHKLTLAMATLTGEVNSLAKDLGGRVEVLAERVESVKGAQKATNELANRLDNFLRNYKG